MWKVKAFGSEIVPDCQSWRVLLAAWSDSGLQSRNISVGRSLSWVQKLRPVQPAPQGLSTAHNTHSIHAVCVMYTMSLYLSSLLGSSRQWRMQHCCSTRLI